MVLLIIAFLLFITSFFIHWWVMLISIGLCVLNLFIDDNDTVKAFSAILIALIGILLVGFIFGLMKISGLGW